MVDYNKVYKRYYKMNVWIIFALYQVGLLVAHVTTHSYYLNMLMVSALFSLITASIYGGAWKAIAAKSPAVLGKFYLAGSALRMLLAFLTILVYAIIVKERVMILSFAVIFMIFYLVLLAFDTIYFSKVEKNNKTNN
ncbi:MAG: hypothetical protein HXO52_02245 [Prevotella sp.]|nr:hypothetical protein [Prevotella sp.]